MKIQKILQVKLLLDLISMTGFLIIDRIKSFWKVKSIKVDTDNPVKLLHNALFTENIYNLV